MKKIKLSYPSNHLVVCDSRLYYLVVIILTETLNDFCNQNKLNGVFANWRLICLLKLTKVSLVTVNFLKLFYLLVFS